MAEMPVSNGLRIPKNVQQVKENLNKPAEVKTEISEQEEAPTASASNKSFTLEQLTQFWNTFAENLKQKGLSNEYMVINNRVLTLDPDFTIHFSVAHDVQLDQFESFKLDLLSFLRHSLNNKAIKVSVNTSFVPSAEKKMFTDEDKFRHLAENYPVVEELRRKFGLEINY
jgi:DNA polymerase-3 subunit gamma/tau